jgi:hypothetical protein
MSSQRKAAIIAPFVLLVLVSCTNNGHDGLYLANQSVAGVFNVWILKGNELTIYAIGNVDVKRCRQYSDRLSVDGKSFPFNDQGDILIVHDVAKKRDYRMKRISDRTDHSFSELNTLVEEAYDNEGSGARGNDDSAEAQN